MLVVAVINVDPYLDLFLLSQAWHVTLRIQEYFFCACTVLPDFEETQIQSCNQGVSHSAAKNTQESSEPCQAQKCVPIAICHGVCIFKVPGCHFLQEIFLQWRLRKLFTAYFSCFNFQLYEMAIYQKYEN